MTERRPLIDTRRPARCAAWGRAVWRLVVTLLLGLTGGLAHGVPGLAANYYNNTTMTGAPALTRTDTTVAFDWGLGSPATGVNSDLFSVRWTGSLRVATTGSYTFQTVSDDGVRLYVNGALVINNWTDHPAATDTSAAVTLTAGTSYPIVLEYYEALGFTAMQLNWKKPGDAAFSTIPADNGSLGLFNDVALLAEYRLEEAAWNGTASEVRDTGGFAGGPYHGKAQGSPVPTASSASPARSGDPGTCRYATMPGPATGGGSFVASGLPLAATSGVQTTVAFWMYWDGTGTPIPVGWSDYVLWITNGVIAFNTNNSDLYGVSSTGLANGWHHVVATFTNGSVTANKLYIDGVAKTLSQVQGTPNLSLAKVTSNLTLGGDPLGTGLRLSGRLDEVRVYNGALAAADVTAEYNRTEPCSTLVAQYRFEESNWAGTAGELKDSAGYASVPYHGRAQGSPLPTPTSASPALTGNPGTCGYAALPGPAAAGGSFVVDSLPLSTVYGSQTTVAFWMYWDGSDARIAIGFNGYDLGLLSGGIGFNTNNSDLYGATSSVLANGWHHVVAVFTNGSVTLNKLYIDGTAQTLTQRTGSPLLANAVAATTLNIGGFGASTGFRFTGRIDEVKVYAGAVSTTTVAALYAERHACFSTPLVAGQRYSFESNKLPGYYIRHYAFFGYVNSISAGSPSIDLYDSTFIARTGLAGSGCWSFESLNYPGYYLRSNSLRIKIEPYAATTQYQQDATFCLVPGLASTAGLTLESINNPGYYIRHLDDLSVGLSQNDGTATFNARATYNVRTGWVPVGPDHLEILHSSGSGLTCTPSTLTVRACQDAACTSLYTGGVTGTMTATGSGMTVNWPTGAAFSIPSGSSSITEDLQVTTAGSVVLGLTGASPAAANATTCNFGSPSCTFTAADAGLFFDVPNHRAEVSNSVSVTAVKKADNSASCVPAFASVSKAVNFKCAYANPTTGTLPVRVGGAALNSGNSASSSCDATGQPVTLAFDGTGKATTSVIYADAGSMTLTATYTGSGADAGLSMTGSDSFTAVPYAFTVAGPAAGNIAAGSNFSGSATAKNFLGNTTPNFGRETSPEGATLGWVRTQPQGSGAVNGSFSGSLGAFSAGTASGGGLRWSEVGRGELSAVLTSGSYLATGMTLAGSTVGAPVLCSAEWSTCSLPAGVTATVYYGANGFVVVRSGMSGNVYCANDVFGDPIFLTAKNCWYVVTSGSSSASTGAVGPFIPHHFDVTATPACSSTFSYAGQPFSATVTARNASNATTVNYDGSANTSPNFAKVTTLADAPVLGLGSWSNASVPIASFALGVASAAPSYSFTTKTTAPQSLVIRATDTNAVSSLNFAEPTMPLRSGRLAISNAFGSEKTTLAVPVQAQYWSGLAWVQNGADSCTTVPAASVVRAAYTDGKGAASTAWTSTASSISISAGAGTLTLGAPSPTTTGSLDFSLNLGSTATDQSCLAAHPTSTGAGLTWLRSQYGACSTAWDRDPSARATFGIYVPETRKTIHVRELF